MNFFICILSKFNNPHWLLVIVALFSITATVADEMDHSAHQKMSASVDIEVSQGIDPDFSLLDGQRKPVSLADFQGKYVLLAFGFTQCEHVCPMMAANMARALRKSSGVEAVGIFISVDTERDTPAITDQYAQSFDSRMIGLSGSYEQVSKAANNFKVSFAVTKSQRNYTVQHTSNIYLLDGQGQLVDIYALNADPDVIASSIK